MKFYEKDLSFYCLPEQNDSGTLIPIDIRAISQKCGLKCKAFEDECSDETMLYSKMLDHGGTILNIEIENMNGNIIEHMNGDIKHYETHGIHSPITLSEDSLDSELIQAISDLKDRIISAGNDFDTLKCLLEELECSTPENRISIKDRIALGCPSLLI